MSEPMAEYIAKQIAQIERERIEVSEVGKPALARLIEVARRDTGQSGVCRRFLLGLYDGPGWPFDLTDLRRLDADLLKDALAVLRADAMGAWPQEIHEVAGEVELFARWACPAYREAAE